MATADDDDHRRRSRPTRASYWKLPSRRIKMTVVRLGSRRGWQGSGRRLLPGILRRLQVQRLAAQYREALKRLRAVMKDLFDDAASTEAVRSRIIMESSCFAAPFFPVTAVSRYLPR